MIFLYFDIVQTVQTCKIDLYVINQVILMQHSGIIIKFITSTKTNHKPIAVQIFVHVT